jgi:O-antigen/teichoic acid export membrane protein
MTPVDSRAKIERPPPASRPPSPTRLHSRLLANRYLRNNTLILGANIVAGFFAYILHPLLGHLMGVRAYGQVAALIALSLVLLTPTQLVATVAARYASSMAVRQSFAQLNDFVRRFTIILLPAGIGIAALFAGASSHIATFFHIGAQEGIVLLSLVFVVSCVTPLNLGAIQGLELFGWYAAITVLAVVLRVALPVVLVLVGLGINGAMLGIALGALLAYVVSFQPLKDILRGTREPMESVRTVWSFALLAAGAAAGMVALFSIDTVLARHYLGAHDAGLYAALATIGRTALFITTSLTVVMFPKVVALHERKEPHAYVAVQTLAGALALAGAVEAVFCIAPSMVAKLLFGQSFAALAETLPLYGLAMLFLAGAQVLVTYLLATANLIAVLSIFLACLLEAALIVWHHATIAQLAQAVVIADAALFIALLLVAWWSSFKDYAVAAARPLGGHGGP